MRKLLISITVLLVAGISLSSCLKEAKVEDPGFNVNETGTNATSLLEIPLDIYLQADRAIRFQYDSIKSKGINQQTPFTFKIGYITLTVSPADTITYPKTIVLDFGSDTTKPYKGKMTINMDGNMRVSGSKCAISYQGLIANGSSISGNDLIVSAGKNASSTIESHFIMQGGELKGYKGEKITYSGNIIGKFNLTSKINVLDSVLLNATDANLNIYKLSSVKNYKLQVAKDCNYFNQGVINTDINAKGILAGTMIFDYGYSSQGYPNTCDYDGALYITSKINLNYKQTYNFYAKEFK